MMDYYVVEVRAKHGHGLWLAVNVMKSQGGRLAIELAESIRRKTHPQIPKDRQRVRRVGYEEYRSTGTELARHYGCGDRLDQMEQLLIGCDALISI